MDCATFVLLFISFSFLSKWCRPRCHGQFTLAHFENSLSLVLAPGAGLSPVCVSIWPGSLQLQLALEWRDEMSQPHVQQQLSFLLQYLVVFTEPTGPSLAGRRFTPPCPRPPAVRPPPRPPPRPPRPRPDPPSRPPPEFDDDWFAVARAVWTACRTASVCADMAWVNCETMVWSSLPPPPLPPPPPLLSVISLIA